MKVVRDRTFRKRRAKGNVPVLIHRSHEFQFTQRALQLRVKIRKRLRVVPNVRTRTMATASVRETALPTPKVAIFKPQYRRRFENGQVCGNRIEHIGRQRRGAQRLLKGQSALSQQSMILRNAVSYLASVTPWRSIIGPPRRCISLGNRAASVGALCLDRVLNKSTHLHVRVWEMPSDCDRMSFRLARCQGSREED